MTVDHGPARTSGGLAVIAAGVAVAALGASPAAGIGSVGTLGVAAGALVGSRRAVTLGAAALLAGILLAGVRGAPAEALLVAGIATVLSWDFGEQAINVGEQLGRAAATRRAELAHVASSTLVGTAAAAAAYAVFRLAVGGQPLAALVFLLVAAVTLVAALRD